MAEETAAKPGDSCVKERNRQRRELERRKERRRLKKERRTCMRADEYEKGTITLVVARGRDREKEREKARRKEREPGIQKERGTK